MLTAFLSSVRRSRTAQLLLSAYTSATLVSLLKETTHSAFKPLIKLGVQVMHAPPPEPGSHIAVTGSELLYSPWTAPEGALLSGAITFLREGPLPH